MNFCIQVFNQKGFTLRVINLLDFLILRALKGKFQRKKYHIANSSQFL